MNVPLPSFGIRPTFTKKPAFAGKSDRGGKIDSPELNAARHLVEILQSLRNTAVLRDMMAVGTAAHGNKDNAKSVGYLVFASENAVKQTTQLLTQQGMATLIESGIDMGSYYDLIEFHGQLIKLHYLPRPELH